MWEGHTISIRVYPPFELSERPELYTKSTVIQKGWILGGGLETDFETIGLKTNIPILDNIRMGMFYNYCPTLTYITTTKHFSNMLVEGRKHEFDMYLTLDLDYELTLGYKYLITTTMTKQMVC
jgi:hypothetical protein